MQSQFPHWGQEVFGSAGIGLLWPGCVLVSGLLLGVGAWLIARMQPSERRPLESAPWLDVGLVFVFAFWIRNKDLLEIGMHHMEVVYAIEATRYTSLLDLLLSESALHVPHMPIHRVLLSFITERWRHWTDVAALREVSRLAGAFAAALLPTLALRLGATRGRAVSCALLLAASPIIVEYGRHTSPYALTILAGVCWLRAWVRVAHSPSRITASVLALATVFVMGCHLVAWCLPLAAVALSCLPRRSGPSISLRKAAVGSFGIGCGFMLHAPWFAFANKDAFAAFQAETGNHPITGTASELITEGLRCAGEILLGPWVPGLAARLVVVALLVWSAWYVWKRWQEGRPERGSNAVVLVACVGNLVGAALITLFTYLQHGHGNPLERYVLTVAPAFIVLFALVPNRRWITAMILGIAALGTVQSIQLVWTGTGRVDTRQLDELLLGELIQPRDAVVVGPGFFQGGMLWGHRGDMLRPQDLSTPLAISRDSAAPKLPPTFIDGGWTDLERLHGELRGPVALGIGDAGISPSQAVQSCLIYRVWFASFSEAYLNGTPTLSTAASERIREGLVAALGPPVEQFEGDRWKLERFAAPPFPLNNESSWDLESEGFRVLASAKPAPSVVAAKRRFPPGALLCAPASASSVISLKLVGEAGPECTAPLTLLPWPDGEPVRCEVENTGQGRIEANCLPFVALQERQLLHVIEDQPCRVWSRLDVRAEPR